MEIKVEHSVSHVHTQNGLAESFCHPVVCLFSCSCVPVFLSALENLISKTVDGGRAGLK
jgi:hypothetical protein